MLFEAQHEASLKKWIVKRLEDVSDADSDYLADFVLALLRHDSPLDEMRRLCIRELEDFLKENPAKFVDDTLIAVNTKSYLPGVTAPPAQLSPDLGILNDSKGLSTDFGNRGGGAGFGSGQNGNQSRKRTYNDREGSESRDGKDSHYARNAGGERAFKQPRRGGARGGRFDSFENRQGRQQGPDFGQGRDVNMSTNPGLSQPPHGSFPGMPPPPPGFPFDPNDPMPAIMAMQAMGFPPLPGMPQFPPAGSPTGFGQQQPGQSSSPMVPKRTGERCKDYDQQGFCALGSTCPYDHGVDHIVVPGQSDEYDPTNSTLMMDASKSPEAESREQRHSDDFRGGGERGRGRGRGRGAGRGSMPSRRGRADFSHAGPNSDPSITTVVVENIPEDKFDESTVREFFASFGNIQDIQMQAYKRLAVVKYDDWASAKRAYDSPKVIFDNRFVKVYWYKPDALPTPPAGANGFPKAGGAGSPLPSAKSAEEMQQEMEEIKRKQEELQKAHEEKMKKIKETEESKRELERRREELLRSQAEETRKLKERLAAKMGGGAASVSSPPALATPGQEQPGGAAAGDKTAKKASAQTEALKAQLAALEAKASSMGIDSALSDDALASSPTGRGRGAYRGRGGYFTSRGRGYDPQRGAYRGRGAPAFARGGRGGGAYKLDNRTKRVAVSGVEFDANRDEGLRQHLLNLGEFASIEPNPERKDSQVVTFKDRFTAEKFIYGSTDIAVVGKVELAWVPTPVAPPSGTAVASAPGIATAAAAANADAGKAAAQSVADKAMRDVGGHKGAAGAEDYDVAEEDDDDRWMAG